ncbi:MAG: hypothetical protein QJR05_03265, partial [Thermoanaerobacterium sp.]|nr:hypothetical protein [Thermoanaerobacterium sp.]
MKRLISLGLLIFLIIQLTGCRANSSNTDNNKEGLGMISNTDKVNVIYDNIKNYYYDTKANLYYETDMGRKGLDQNKYSFVWPVAVVMQ